MTVQPSARPNVKRRPRMTGATIAVLALRVSQVEQDVDEMQSRVDQIQYTYESIKNRLNLWGGILLGALSATGLVNGNVVSAIKAMIGQ